MIQSEEHNISFEYKTLLLIYHAIGLDNILTIFQDEDGSSSLLIYQTSSASTKEK